MRTSKYLLYTLKKIPDHIESTSHQLMLKSGLIRQSNSGIYTWLPNGLKVLKNIKKIIRTEMDIVGANEICFPIMQSDELWKKSNRFKQYGKELIKLYDRNNNCFILSPTYEEMVTDFIKQEIMSYKKLPITLYQIQTKFRDEIRPRFGITRTREFIMKDAYSFHENMDCLKKKYKKMRLIYEKIFKKMNINFYSVKAECGIIGGNYSHEFQALSKSGEDKIIISYNKNKKINNINLLTKKFIENNFFYKKKIHVKKINNKNKYEIKNICNNMKKNIIKNFIMKINKNKNNYFIGCMIRGDHLLDINKIKKIKNLNLNNKNIIFATKSEIKNIFSKKKNNNLFFLIIDIHILYLKKIIPLNIINDKYFKFNIFDQYFKNIKVDNIIINNNKKYKIKNCIEIGHIFQIGKKYSKIIDAKILNINGIKKFIHMGCYGIGVTRLISTIIEQNHDKKGIIWPKNIAPFQLLIIPIKNNKCKKIQEISEYLYYKFKKKNIKVLLEDRNEQTGVIFSDANLIGIPNIIIINKNTIKNQTIEYQERKNIDKKIIIHINNIINFIIKKIKL
ncbi:proline--tRNA ligase [Buchnera aphidicola]|uniref:Proline--tRNA ligase n=1 Tax=Buchnera aphidicola (Therioaphis trifolii) TaxID=1241884 RepID=A0A4D6YMG8_9GAMM|nr:proline--tRNA ligase [Buchnera aphidicola]QCI27164.1 proline--tRNA ligase [Buchnera aphidicola (Therioaphis trifolii)]